MTPDPFREAPGLRYLQTTIREPLTSRSISSGALPLGLTSRTNLRYGKSAVGLFHRLCQSAFPDGLVRHAVRSANARILSAAAQSAMK